MSVSIQEVIESAGYDLDNVADALWLLSQVSQFEELIVNAEDLLENTNE